MQAIVESIDGNSARVLVGDEQVAIAIPLNMLPPHVRPGTVLRTRFTVDQAATNARDRREAAWRGRGE